MHGQGKKQQEHKGNSPSGRARVVDLSAWKSKKRKQGVRGSRTWWRIVLLSCTQVTAVIAAALALAGCVPSQWQYRLIVWSWVFAVTGTALGLTSNALLERRAKPWLLVLLVSMAVSLLAAMIHLWLSPT
ncbi:hypothetical protein D2Q93_00695 [Alicyclobacillaceae bacterium I2511]|nr:hypothetical protein D2Q93_00695 [Alicyclobacillaceae bacterium I2511]